MKGVLEAVSALTDRSEGGGFSRLSLAVPWALLGLIPAVLSILVMALRRKVRAAFLFTRGELAARLPTSGVMVTEAVPRVLTACAMVLMVVALARPQVRGAVRPQDTEGIDMMIALDLSTSMRAADFKPKDRLFVAKEVITQFITRRKNDRIGLVVFAKDAFTQAPLTMDYTLLVNLIQELRTGVIEDGTAIGNGLATALNRLRDSVAKTRIVILLTDGDNNSGQIAPEQAADIAAKMGVKVFAIVVGRGGKVPFPSGQDLFGNPTYELVDLPVNIPLLRQVAVTTGGAMYNAADREGLIDSFEKILETLEKSKLEDARGRAKPVDVYPLLLWPALLFLMLALMLETTRLARVP